MNEQALLELGQDIAKEMQQQLTALNAVRTGTLYRSLNAYTIGTNQIAIQMEYYGPFVNDGHKTRLGTSTKPNYKPSPLHSQAFTRPKPFIDNAVSVVIDNKIEEFINKMLP